MEAVDYDAPVRSILFQEKSEIADRLVSSSKLTRDRNTIFVDREKKEKEDYAKKVELLKAEKTSLEHELAETKLDLERLNNKKIVKISRKLNIL